MPGWQTFYQRYHDKGFELVSVAMDVQGAEAAKPWVEKASATYVALIDRANRLGAQFDFNYVPLSILFDESGRMVRGPCPVHVAKQEDREEIVAWLTRGVLALRHETPTRERKRSFATPETELRFHLAVRLLQQGDKPVAVRQLRQALEKSPGNWIILKQIWAIEHPERFYDGDVDFDWQREQMKEMEGKKTHGGE